MKKRLLCILIILTMALSLGSLTALAETVLAVDTDQASYQAGDTVNVLQSSSSDLMIEVFLGDASTGTKVVSSATTDKTYSFKTGSDWSAGTYTVVVGAGSNTASCTFTLTASSGGTPTAQYVYLTVYGPDSALLNTTAITYASGMSAYTILKNYSGLDVTSEWSTTYSGYYVSAIEGYRQKDYGESSGWMYSVNGVVPMVGSSNYTLSVGNSVTWYYTEDGSTAMYSGAGGGTSDASGSEETGTVFTADSNGSASITSDELGEMAGTGFSVESDTATVTFEAGGSTQLSEALGTDKELTVTITETDADESSFTVVSGDGTIAAFDIDITAGATEITDGFGTMTVSVNVGSEYAGTALNILHLKENGEYEILTGTVDDDGNLTFDVTSLSTFVVLDEENIPVEYIFNDVAEGQWYTEFIQYVYSQGIMGGTSDTTFEPDTVMSRAMLVTVLYRMAGEPLVTAVNSFDDVTNDTSWYYDAVIWASENEIVEGYGNGMFAPGDDVTRQQIVTILWRYAAYQGYDIESGTSTDITDYEDAETISVWAQDAFLWAVGNEIISGTSATTLSPAVNGSRCEVATMIARFAQSFAE